MKKRLTLSKYYYGPKSGRSKPHYYRFNGKWMRDYKGVAIQVIGLELQRLLHSVQ